MPELDRDRLVWMYTQMLRIREFEERVKGTFEEHPGVIRGHTHLADGAEASIVGSLATLRDDDQLLTTYRCHGYPIALGTDPNAIMAEIYGRKDGLCGGYGGSMHLTDVGRGFLGTSGIVGQGIPHAAGAAYAAQIRGKGQVVLSFFGDGASKQGAFHESLNIASLWKLPVVFVMENNNYNVVTRVEQEDANAAAGEPLAVKAKAFSMPGETVDGGDPLAVYETVGAAVERARSGEGPTLVESLVYRLSAHGNLIAPPGRAAPLPGARGDRALRQHRGVRGGQAGRPGAALPRAARRGRDAERRGGRRDRRARAGGDAGGGRLRARQPPPGGRGSRRVRLRSRGFDDERASVHRRDRRGDPPGDGARRQRPLLRPEHRHHRRRPLPEGVRLRPRPGDADLRDGRDRDGDRRRDGRLPAGGRAVHGGVHARRHGPGRERGEPLPLHDEGPGEGAGRAQGGLRLHRRLGRPAHGHDLRDVHGRARPEGGAARDAGRRKGSDDCRDSRRQPGRVLPPLPAHARARRRPRGRARRAARAGERRPRGR